MKASDVFQSKYLRCEDLKGRDVSLTIDRVEMAQMPNGGQRKPALFFRGKEKGLILNKTNFNTIASVLAIEVCAVSTGWPLSIRGMGVAGARVLAAG